ncbi:Clathrin light chain [Malassezia sp. CBS 17886]|nr:Clathrin light chain [Malassezia sp. CBS 17886]
MSFDFATFEDKKAADPTSDFLERERQAAGELLGDDSGLFGAAPAAEGAAVGHDFEERASEFPALDDDVAAPAAPVSDGRGLSRDSVTESKALENASRAENGATADDPEAAFQANFPALETAPVASVDTAGIAETTEEQWDTPADSAWEAEAPRASDVPDAAAADKETPFSYGDLDAESETLRAWREQKKDDVARRDAHAERMRAEAVSKAEQEIDQFYADYNAQKEKNIKKNKEAEARFQEQKTKELAEGTTWTRITKLLDLQNSQSKTIAKGGPGTSDRMRMKELYLSLRREGDTAPGAAGY